MTKYKQGYLRKGLNSLGNIQNNMPYKVEQNCQKTLHCLALDGSSSKLELRLL